MYRNPLTLIDGYKIDHRRQYPPGTTKVYSNWTPRGSRVPGATGIIFFGLQYFIQEYLIDLWAQEFFAQDKNVVVDDYHSVLCEYLGPAGAAIPLDHIASLHDLGYLPLRICAVPEGTFVPLRVPALTIENTHPEHAWLVNYLETLMSNVLWKPCTSASTAFRLRQILEDGARLTGANRDFIDWQGHDFSFRGMSGNEDACLSGAGHLVFFSGTDTIPAIETVQHYYDANGLVGGSVAATEHSVMCAGGQDNELETYCRLLTKVYPAGIVSIVSDTWNLWTVLTQYLPTLKDQILARDGKLVIRPDSGDPVKIVCGNSTSSNPYEAAGVVELLWGVFGGTTNAEGYRTLDPHVGCIYGDSINEERMRAIIHGLAAKGFASDNMVFGVGSYTYEYVTRDTYGFAMKATYTENDGGGCALSKSPVTDSGEKWSARGRLAVLPDDVGTLKLICDATSDQEMDSELRPVFENGELLRYDNFEDVRQRARRNLIRG